MWIQVQAKPRACERATALAAQRRSAHHGLRDVPQPHSRDQQEVQSENEKGFPGDAY